MASTRVSAGSLRLTEGDILVREKGPSTLPLVAGLRRTGTIRMDEPLVLLTIHGKVPAFQVCYPVERPRPEFDWVFQEPGRLEVTLDGARGDHIVGMTLGHRVAYLKDMLLAAGDTLHFNARLRGDSVELFRFGEAIPRRAALQALAEQWDRYQVPAALLSGRSSAPQRIERKAHSAGIVCDSLDDVEALLREYAFPQKEAAEGPRQTLYEDTSFDACGVETVLERQGILGEAWEMLSANARPIVEQVIRQNRESKGSFSCSFDMDGFGTPFYKTSITVKPCRDRFLVSFTIADVADANASVAERTERPIAVHSMQASAFLTPSVEGWTRIDGPGAFPYLAPPL